MAVYVNKRRDRSRFLMAGRPRGRLCTAWVRSQGPQASVSSSGDMGDLSRLDAGVMVMMRVGRPQGRARM